MSAVFGASLGVSGIRGLVMDPTSSPPTSTESFVHLPNHQQDHWEAVTSAVKGLAPGATVPVLALRDKNPTEAFGVEYVDGIALVSDIGAQIGALHESGALSGEKTIALFDVGAGGVTVSIVDRDTGHVHESRRSTVLSGDACDAALTRYLLDRHGYGRPLAPEVADFFVDTVCSAKESLSRIGAVDVAGPFPGGTVTVRRSDLEDLVRNDVYDAVTLAEKMIAAGPRVDALFAVGGGANMQIVRRSLFDAVSVPVFVPVAPELLAATGAVGTARGFASGSGPVRAAGPPRHSDSSARHRGRLKRSRYLGGAVAILLAGGVAAAAAALPSHEEQRVPVVEVQQSATTTARPATSVVVPAAVAPTLEPSVTEAVPSTVPVAPPVIKTTTPESSAPTTTTRAPRTTTASPTTTATTTEKDEPREPRTTSVELTSSNSRTTTAPPKP